MGKIEKILKKGPVEGQTTEVYPVTSTKAVYDENNKRLDNIITGLQESVYLNTPIPISTEDTPEAHAQNVKNIADYIEKAKAAGIEDVNGMAVTCLINDNYSGVGYLYGTTDTYICGIISFDDTSNPYNFSVDSDGQYQETEILIKGASDQITSFMLVQGARKPIILTPDTTEVDEETYQKLLSDDVDVVFKNDDWYIPITVKGLTNPDAITLEFSLTLFDGAALDTFDSVLIDVQIGIAKNSPHRVTFYYNETSDLDTILQNSGYFNKSTLTPVLQEIDLTGTDAERKAKLDQFEADWKALTDAIDLNGARFVGSVETPKGDSTMVFTWNDVYTCYTGVGFDDTNHNYKCKVQLNGTIHINPLFSHLEAITINIDNTPESKAANVAAIEAYEDNLEALGFDMTKGYMIPITASGRNGFLSTRSGNYPYVGYVSADSSVSDFYNILILGNGEYYDSKIQSENSEELNTISKKLVPAINEVNTLSKNKQDKLTSGTNIKTINNQSLLGSGNIEISTPSITVDTTISDTSMNPVQNKVIKAYIDGLVGNVAAQLAQI